MIGELRIDASGVTAVGLGAIVVLALTHVAAIAYALPLAAGLTLSIPLTVVTALPAVDAALVRGSIGRLAEEIEPPVTLRSLALAAMAGRPQSRAAA
jgi:membrane glycosyltransferase